MRLAAFTAAAVLAAFLMSAAQAQQMPVICQPHAKISKHLLTNYNEVVIANGLAGSALFELFASAAGTWTVVVTRPDAGNLACVQGTGTDLNMTGNEFPSPPDKSDPA